MSGMIVEDGTGLNNSTSYTSVGFADDYFSARNTEWLEKQHAEKERALVLATDFVDNMFVWRGRKKTNEQALAFPRVDIHDIDGYTVTGIPTKLKQAVCDAAIETFNSGDLFEVSEAAGAVTSERIGDISFSYDVSKKKQDITLFESVNKKLRGLYRDTNKSRIVISRIVK